MATNDTDLRQRAVCAIGMLNESGDHARFPPMLMGSGFCVDAADRKTNGGKVSMWRCDPNNPNQQWDTRKRKRDE